ncbi:MAG: hypothetical protein IKE91_07870 [Clostridia bacterium]|nr:hypothetical protein [Clostridia bacterium]
MEPQEYYLTKGCFKNRCMTYIVDILLVAFFTTIGIIIGASVAETIMQAMAALITLAITFGVLLIVPIVLMICNRRKKDCGC